MNEDITVARQRNVLAKNIQKLLDSRGINQTTMAKDLNLAETTVSSWMKAKRYPGLKNLQLIADYFNVRRSDLTEENPSNLMPISPQSVSIPVLGEIACGDPILISENISTYRNESPDNLPTGNLYFVIAQGKSMEPTIPNGSHVLIREQPDVETGQIAAVLVNDDTEVTLKRVKKQNDLIVLMPDNPNYEPYIVTKDNPGRILGKAIRYTQDL